MPTHSSIKIWKYLKCTFAMDKGQKNMNDDKELKEMEWDLEIQQINIGFGYLIKDHKAYIKTLEDKHRKLLLQK